MELEGNIAYLWKTKIKNLINDKTKFKELTEDVTIKRESKLQRFLRTLKNNKCLDDIEYEKNLSKWFFSC